MTVIYVLAGVFVGLAVATAVFMIGDTYRGRSRSIRRSDAIRHYPD